MDDIIFIGSPEFPETSGVFALVDQPEEQDLPLMPGQFRVLFQDSYWTAICLQSNFFAPLREVPSPGTWVRVIGRKNITLIVETDGSQQT